MKEEDERGKGKRYVLNNCRLTQLLVTDLSNYFERVGGIKVEFINICSFEMCRWTLFSPRPLIPRLTLACWNCS